MERRAVTSTAVAVVGYDAAEHVLEVEYVGGDVYYYYDVPPHVHEEFLAAPSLGIYVNQQIKPNYRWVRADDLS